MYKEAAVSAAHCNP